MAATGPRRIVLDPAAPNPSGIAEAAEALRRGQLVVFPTETVYGVGANADDLQAIGRLYRIKGRPADRPLTVHLPDAAWVGRVAVQWPDAAARLTRQFWPGPLTVVVPRLEGGTVGLRVPRHPIAQAILAAAGVLVVVPSANRSGQPPPVTADEAERALGPLVDLIVDGGMTVLGESSTVVDCTTAPPRLVRDGAMGAAIRAAMAAR